MIEVPTARRLDGFGALACAEIRRLRAEIRRLRGPEPLDGTALILAIAADLGDLSFTTRQLRHYANVVGRRLQELLDVVILDRLTGR